ncbi:dynein regulatory complex protein 9-like [Cydia pomonella]|uniref:dynein regulatory complex protein 9-like n=1 Tax=Cydia pomonella TaxID=82600 RepID=UPI002ADE0644|nr:dynein regulatory complex protein 9-like [Cydia pomonella]
MNKNRIVSVAEGPWGRATIYSNEPVEDKTTQKFKTQEPERPITFLMEKKHSESSQQTVVSSYKFENNSIKSSMFNAEDIYRLPNFEASLFATIFEDTITELRILVECNTEMRISKLQSDMGLLLAIKFGVKQPLFKDVLDGIDPKHLGCNEYKLNKLDADRKYLAEVLQTSYTDLALNKSYMILAEHVKEIVDRDNYRAQLQEAEARHRILRRDTNRQLRQQRNHIKSVTYDTDAIIDDLRTQVEDFSLNAETCTRYVNNWERARTEQHLQTIYDAEYTPSQVVEYFKQRTDNEQRVHTEVELLINIAINETLEEVERWMEKYDKDMEKIDLKIQIKKNEYQNARDERMALEETIEKHDKLMKDWIHFKDEREKERQYRETMNKSAITVQAWWRGLLVRRQLGPYKPAKKPPAKKK